MKSANKNILLIFLIVFPFLFQGIFENFIIPIVSLEQMLLTGLIAQITAIGVVAILYGRIYCSLLCQIGAAQRVCNLIVSKISKKSFSLSLNADKYMRYIKYIALVLTVLISFYTGKFLFEPSPQDQYNFLFPNVIFIEIIVSAIIILGSLLNNRFFCKYLCIHGAIIGMLGCLSPFKLKRNETVCINCKKCTKICPMAINVHTKSTITDKDCVKCRNCEMACPKEDALGIYFLNKKMPYTLLYILVILTYVVAIVITSIIVYQIL